MARYIWTIGGQAYPKAEPLLIRRGDRVEVEMKNETMMWHPMHLHGHFFSRSSRRRCIQPIEAHSQRRTGRDSEVRVHRRQSGPLVLPLPQSLPP
jgi:FtsP/CotA-like multicopper oxidase with cupredoxin domain